MIGIASVFTQRQIDHGYMVAVFLGFQHLNADLKEWTISLMEGRDIISHLVSLVIEWGVDKSALTVRERGPSFCCFLMALEAN